jgi:tetratricopeptide (TPR) repeat protein
MVDGKVRSSGLSWRQLWIFGLILYFTFIGGSFYSDLNFPLWVFNQLVVTAILGVWLIGKLRRGERWPRTALDAPILAWLAAHFISALFGLSPRFSLERLWAPFTYALAFYLLVDLRRKAQTTVIVRGLYMSAAIVCLVGLAEFSGWYLGLPLLSQFAQGWPAIGGLKHPFPPTLYRLNFTLNGATPLSAYLALLIPPALAIWLTSHSREDRQAITAWLVLAVIVEILSFSRGGVLALLVSLPLTGLGWWLARRDGGRLLNRARNLWSARRPAVIGSLAVIVLLVMLAGPVWLGRTFHRTGSTQFRFTLWEVALSSFTEHPLTGVGPYNFGRSLLRRNDSQLPRLQIMTAHDVYLNTAAETGLIGLLAGAWLLVAAGRAWLIRWRHASAPDERVQIAATGAALAGFAAHSLVDTFAATPNVLPVLAIAAFALTNPLEAAEPVGRFESRMGPTSKARSRFPVGISLVALVLYLVGLVWLDVGQFYFQRSLKLAQQGSMANAVSAANRAYRLDPAMALYTFQLAYLQGQIASAADTSSAIELYQAGLKAEPVDGRQTANLAAVLWQSGNHEAAIDAMRQAIEAWPDPVWLVNLGYFYQQVDNLDRALEMYGRALALSPQLASSEFWQDGAQRAAHWQNILADGEAILTAQGVQTTTWRLGIALAQADWPVVAEQAQSILKEQPADCGALSALARARFEAGSIDAAGDIAQQAIDAQSACGGAYVVLGLVNQAGGDLGAAERDWRTAIFLNQRQAAYYLGQLYQAHGDSSGAARFYSMALSPTAVPIDVEVTLYNRKAAFDLLPPLFRIGLGPMQAQPWIALAQLREAQGDLVQARQVYLALLAEDSYLTIAQEKVNALGSDQ